MNLSKLLKYRKYKIFNRLVYRKFGQYGVFLPCDAIIDETVQFRHNEPGTVIHSNSVIESNVKIYQNVTLGRADVFNEPEKSKFKGILVKKNAILGAGAKILCDEGVLTIGRNSVIAANSVVLESVPDYEVWGGIPAKKISEIVK